MIIYFYLFIIPFYIFSRASLVIFGTDDGFVTMIKLETSMIISRIETGELRENTYLVLDEKPREEFC